LYLEDKPSPQILYVVYRTGLSPWRKHQQQKDHANRGPAVRPSINQITKIALECGSPRKFDQTE
jgi:hypothetical protein